MNIILGLWGLSSDLTVYASSTDDYNGKFVVFRHLASSKVIDSNTKKDVYILPENGGNFQKWKAVGVGDSTYRFCNVSTGFYLDSDGKGAVYTHAGNHGLHQQWSLSETSIDGYFVVKNKATNLVLDSNGSNVYTLAGNKGNYQSWKLDIRTL